MELNFKQQQFVTAYFREKNATRAAIEAGYSAKTAHSTGPRLLCHAGVKKELQRLTDEKRAANVASYDEACEILSLTMRGEIPRHGVDKEGRIIEYPASPGDRVKAIERLSKMRGWDKPEHLHHSGYIADRPPCELTDDELAAIAASGTK